MKTIVETLLSLFNINLTTSKFMFQIILLCEKNVTPSVQTCSKVESSAKSTYSTHKSAMLFPDVGHNRPPTPLR